MTEINRELELVQILLYLAGRQDKTAQVLENRYYISRIKSYFAGFENHEAVLLTRRLVDERNFIHIKPIRAVLSLDTIAKDETDRLFHWAKALKCFREDSAFDRFFDGNSAYYEMILDHVRAININHCVDYTRSYFKDNSMELTLFICPFAGNYGFLLNSYSYVVRCIPYDENGNVDAKYPANLIRGIAHEYAHCFVNPVVKKYNDQLDLFDHFFSTHINIPAVYNVNYAVINEYFVRAYVRHYLKLCDIGIDEFADKWEKERFIYIDNFVSLMSEYERSSLSFEQYYLNALQKIGELA